MNKSTLRLINVGLLVAYSLCYLEWGGGNSSFIFQAEYDLLSDKDKLLSSLTHPLIISGLIGQFLLLYSIFKKTPNRTINVIGILVLSPVVLLALLAGVLSFNMKIVVSTLPFVILSVIYFLKSRNNASVGGAAMSE